MHYGESIKAIGNEVRMLQGCLLSTAELPRSLTGVPARLPQFVISAWLAQEFGDGIMSAIDMFASIDVITGKLGEKRMVISLNGKWLPHIVQKVENNTAKPPI